MAIMANWAREWNIVRSDVDFKHVIFPKQPLTLVPAEQDGELGYTISHNGSDCAKGCFQKTFLRVRGGTFLPDLETICGKDSNQLQKEFTNDKDHDKVLKDVADFVNKHGPTLVRLEGAIELPEHARTPGEDMLEFYVYQISNAVREDRTLVFFQAKLPSNPASSNAAANGGGSVTGYS
jgi:hypothetical protein